MRIKATGVTHVGMRREGNEDSYACDIELGLFVVADGMGGHAAGEVASGTAVSTIADFIREHLPEVRAEESSDPQHHLALAQRSFVRSVQEANQRICTLSEENPTYAGMGTTVSGMLALGEKGIIAHVGDSRIYLFRDGRLQALTNDHSWVNEQLQRNIITPEEAKNHRWRNVITRALGNKTDLEVDTFTQSFEVDDLYLLCSDGLTGMIEENEIEEVLGEGGDLDRLNKKLIDMANEAGGLDNITSVLVKVEA